VVAVARESPEATGVLGAHADRLRERGIADAVHTATWGTEPGRDLLPAFDAVAADRVFVVPVRAAHCHATTDGVPAALDALDGTVHYCEPVGPSARVTDALAARATRLVEPAPDASLVLVGRGSGDQPFARRAAERHATRLRRRTAYGEVTAAFLQQNPTVECARYAVDNDRVVAVPLPLIPAPATESAIPRKLAVDRGGLAYADPLGTDPAVTDAVAARVAERRAAGADTSTFEADLAADGQRLAADGKGELR
jgi:sirohydrochlorin ferrochelatase